jgi:hypothetical protein
MGNIGPTNLGTARIRVLLSVVCGHKNGDAVCPRAAPGETRRRAAPFARSGALQERPGTRGCLWLCTACCSLKANRVSGVGISGDLVVQRKD